MKKVTIQGVAGCYHDAAAHLYFNGEEIQTVACETFPAMFETLANDASLFGIMAIENTIAGSLLQNHELLRQSNLSIIGELKLRISHVIASLPGQTIDELSEVNSHPMALMQCEQFLRRHPNLKIVERLDTAGSAKEIAEGNLTGHAAVCGEYAANLYGLNILEKGSRPTNATSPDSLFWQIRCSQQNTDLRKETSTKPRSYSPPPTHKERCRKF